MENINLEKELLFQEYRLAWETWFHADNLRQARNTNYITMNSIFIVGIGAGITLLDEKNNRELEFYTLVTMISVLATFICYLWFKVLSRNTQFQNYFRSQTRNLEKSIIPLSSINNYYSALYKHEIIEFKNIKETFLVSKHGKTMNALSEDRLPIYFMVFWIVIFLFSLVSAINQL
jgi:uncharacterized membrane protein YozB (DUF420 family)